MKGEARGRGGPRKYAHFVVDEHDLRTRHDLAHLVARTKVRLNDMHRTTSESPHPEPGSGFDDLPPRERRRVLHVLEPPRFAAGSAFDVSGFNGENREGLTQERFERRSSPRRKIGRAHV